MLELYLLSDEAVVFNTHPTNKPVYHSYNLINPQN